MIVVADASPLHYLVLTGEIEVLFALYGDVIVPSVVLAELSHTNAPPPVARWAAAPPSWVKVRPVTVAAPKLTQLDAGEAAAIALAQSFPDSLLLIDETLGRSEAKRLGIATIGTIGILRLGAERHLVDLEPALNRLLQTNFRVSRAMVDETIRRHKSQIKPANPFTVADLDAPSKKED